MFKKTQETIVTQKVSVDVKKLTLRHPMEEDLKLKIINGSTLLFLKFGFKSITMDDIVRELGISKKTLYQYFSDKNELVLKCIERHLQEEKNSCQELGNKKLNPVAFLIQITESLSDKKKQINQSILFDLKKYFKEGWELLNEYRITFIYNQMMENLQKGKDEGYYKADINENLIAKFYIHMIEFMVNPDNDHDSQLSIKDIHFEMMKYHIRGICTEKGIKIFNKYLEKLDTQKI
jgi:AcrR family transcriptional regulator